MSPIRMTYATAAVLQALDAGHRYGFDIATATRLRRGTVYPILRRLEDAGLLRSSWESPEESHDAGRPPRKYYQLERTAGAFLAACSARYPAPTMGADLPPRHSEP